MTIAEGEVVLLVVEEAAAEEAKRRRDRNTEAIFPVGDTLTSEEEDGVWVAMACDPGHFDPDRARYHRVCIVASETSPVRDWMTEFFRTSVHPLVSQGGLHVCAPPFERGRAEPVSL